MLLILRIVLTQVDEKEIKFIVAYVSHSNNNEGYKYNSYEGDQCLVTIWIIVHFECFFMETPSPFSQIIGHWNG